MVPFSCDEIVYLDICILVSCLRPSYPILHGELLCDFYYFKGCFSRMLQMLSGPTLYRLTVPVTGVDPSFAPGSSIDVDTHVRLAGGQSYVPYVTQSYIEQFGTFLDSLGADYDNTDKICLKIIYRGIN